MLERWISKAPTVRQRRAETAGIDHELRPICAFFTAIARKRNGLDSAVRGALDARRASPFQHASAELLCAREEQIVELSAAHVEAGHRLIEWQTGARQGLVVEARDVERA